MKCCVHIQSLVASQTREARKDHLVTYEDDTCTAMATFEVMEDGWRPICPTHAVVYQDYEPQREFRPLVFIIDEEPEFV
jgi:hypothetical protein